MSIALHRELINSEAVQFAFLMQAYRECSPEIQSIVGDMTEIIADEESSREEREHAIDVLVEALLPGLANDMCEADRLRQSSAAAIREIAALDAEESTFAESLRRLMDERQFTQERLAKLTGVSQPAIANILGRKCRPQQRTVQKFAEALGVDPSDLWPVA